ncbi:hypothetical protein [Massilia sp. MS-15]|nr:hypothetical protein [Massilia sp. MS-15]
MQVLDAAVEPERKFKPQRSIVVVLSALGALFFAVIWAWYVDKKVKPV